MEIGVEKTLIVVAVYLLEEDGYTKVSVIAAASQGEIEPAKFSVSYPTNSSNNIEFIEMREKRKSIEVDFDDDGYPFMKSRETVVKALLDFLRNRVFGDVIELLNNDIIMPGQRVIEYKLLFDYSRMDMKRLEATVGLIADALTTVPDRSWMLKLFGTPVLLDDIVFASADAIRCARRMISAYLTS